jgi:hypothetical protein
MYKVKKQKRKKEITNMNVNKNDVLGLIFYYQNTAEIDPGIQETTLNVLNDVLVAINDEEAAAKKKRKSPNKSGVLQIDPETGKVIAEFKTQNEALEAIGKEGKSGISDAVRGRVKTHKAYGYLWYFKDEFPGKI